MSINSIMQFVGFETRKVDYELLSSVLESDLEFYRKVEPNVEEKKCNIIIGVRLVDSERNDSKTLKLNVEIAGVFQFEDDSNFIEENIKNLIIPNGTAILFPYLRTLISNITSFDTLGEGIIIPTINTMNLFDNHEE